MLATLLFTAITFAADGGGNPPPNTNPDAFGQITSLSPQLTDAQKQQLINQFTMEIQNSKPMVYMSNAHVTPAWIGTKHQELDMKILGFDGDANTQGITDTNYGAFCSQATLPLVTERMNRLGQIHMQQRNAFVDMYIPSEKEKWTLIGEIRQILDAEGTPNEGIWPLPAPIPPGEGDGA